MKLIIQTTINLWLYGVTFILTITLLHIILLLIGALVFKGKTTLVFCSLLVPIYTLLETHLCCLLIFFPPMYSTNLYLFFYCADLKVSCCTIWFCMGISLPFIKEEFMAGQSAADIEKKRECGFVCWYPFCMSLCGSINIISDKRTFIRIKNLAVSSDFHYQGLLTLPMSLHAACCKVSENVKASPKE